MIFASSIQSEGFLRLHTSGCYAGIAECDAAMGELVLVRLCQGTSGVEAPPVITRVFRASFGDYRPIAPGMMVSCSLDGNNELNLEPWTNALMAPTGIVTSIRPLGEYEYTGPLAAYPARNCGRLSGPVWPRSANRFGMALG